MKKIVLLAIPLIALVFAVACKKQEAAVTTEQPAVEQPAATEAAPEAAPVEEKKGK